MAADNHKPKRIKAPFIACSLFFTLIFLIIFITCRTYHFIGPYPLEELKSLSYVSWIPLEERKGSSSDIKAGVVKYDRNKTSDGINIYASIARREVYLMDMAGGILHRWSIRTEEEGDLQHVRLCGNGDLLAIIQMKSLMRVGWDSGIKWRKKIRAHHDIFIDKQNDIYCLTAKDEIVFLYGLPVPVLNDYITIISEDGEIKREISMFALLKDRISFETVGEIYSWICKPKTLTDILKRKTEYPFTNDTPPDIFHVNTVQAIDQDIEGFARKGDLLICVRSMDLICVVDL